uniref:KAT8 regulatory NSL complex subunit 2 n=1 Tax=Davidia involucrata TaxID=16924 RepID=A0A5B7BDB2_DAVIN
MAKPSNNASSASTAMAIDGSDEDSALSKSEFLTRQEVLKRRSRRLKQLARVYRDHYWSLTEELKLKHREYYWEYGKSPFQDDEDIENLDRKNSTLGTGEDANTNNNGSKLGLGMGVIANRCVVNGCKLKAMALTRFCHSHILSDAQQKLYRGCNYVTKSSPAGPIFCMKPILRSTVPSLCTLHLQKAEKHVTRALKKAGLNVTSTSKLAPKFHVIVAEFVRQIQTKRRSAQKEIVDTVEIKVDNTC